MGWFGEVLLVFSISALCKSALGRQEVPAGSCWCEVGASPSMWYFQWMGVPPFQGWRISRGDTESQPLSHQEECSWPSLVYPKQVQPRGTEQPDDFLMLFPGFRAACIDMTVP